MSSALEADACRPCAPMPTTVTWPPRRVARQAARMVAARPTHSKAWSTPRPAGAAPRTALAEPVVGDQEVGGAGGERQLLLRRRTTSTAMTGPAPAARAACSTARPDPAEADDGHRLAGRRPAAVLRTAPTPVSTAQPSSAASLERQLGRDRDDGALGGTTTSSANAPRPRPDVQRLAVGGACRGAAAGAAGVSRTATARRRRRTSRRRHGGAQLSTTWSPTADPVDARADLDHHAGRLVPEHQRVRRAQRAVDHGQVGVADAGGADPHPDLAGAGRGQVDLAPSARDADAADRARSGARTRRRHRWIAFVSHGTPPARARPSSRPRPDCL